MAAAIVAERASPDTESKERVVAVVVVDVIVVVFGLKSSS